MTPPTDIILCARGTSEFPLKVYFERCIELLRQHTHNYRLILVDDNSEQESAEVIENVARQNRNTLLIRTFKQHWFTRAHNLGLRFARTPWVVTLNTDTEPDAGWLDELYAVRDDFEATQGRRVGLVGSEHSPPEPRRWQETRFPSTPGDPGYVTGHCWLLNMQALCDVSAARGTPGIYLNEVDQSCIHIYSDNEICRMMNANNYATVRSFKSAVGHHGGKSWGHNLAVLGLPLEAVQYHYEP
jgi:glycosyltransferase involved in cell wall biosynthesis